MKLTTQNIIQMLPFDEEFKTKMLSGWDSFSEDQRFELEQIIWDAYSAIYQITYDTNLEEALLHVEDGEEELKGLGERVKEKTEQDMQAQFTQGEASTKLSEARDALHKIIDNQPN